MLFKNYIKNFRNDNISDLSPISTFILNAPSSFNFFMLNIAGNIFNADEIQKLKNALEFLDFRDI